MKRFLTPSMPVHLARSQPQYLRPPSVDPREHLPVPGPLPPAQGEVKLMALLWATWDQGTGDPATLSSSFSRKGHNWPIWEDAIKTRIVARGGNLGVELVQNATSFQVNGEACIDLASMFDLVVLGHWWPKAMVDSIKSRSTAPGGTLVLLWGDFESQNQKLPFPTLRQPVWTAAKGFPISSAGDVQNAYGCRTIDKFETSDPSPGKIACNHDPLESGLPSEASLQTAHTWDIDIYGLTDNGQEDGQTVEGYIFDGYFSALGFPQGYFDLATFKFAIDGFIWDNLLEFPFAGSASNAYRSGWTGDYNAGWKAFVRTFRNFTNSGNAWRSEIESTWANGPIGVGVYSIADIRGRYVEHFFRQGSSAKTFAQIAADLDAMRSTGVHAVLAANGTVGQTNIWAETAAGPNPIVNGTWAQIVAELKAHDIVDRVYVAACQQLAVGHTFWQAGFRAPT